MKPDQFEQLVSQWLDQPQNHELRARIEAAAAESPELARLKDEWVALDRLVRRATPTVQALDWERLQQRIVQQVQHAAEETAGPEPQLDDVLRGHTAVERRVDWPRYRRRVIAAVGAAERPAVIRFPLRRVVAGLGLAAAAAVLALVFLVPPRSPRPTRGFAQTRVSPVAEPASREDAGEAFARVTVLPPDDARDGPRGEPQERFEARLGEVFLVIAPAARTEPPAGPLAMFGSF
ncbi:MAG TPA: hypothetical protein VM487_07405 [Phycisphaerae bacterium]|nr:hypothetical protein [Phycisphaerae bacterium]